jgi:hypothetical protein
MDLQTCYEQLAEKLRVLDIHKRKIKKPGVKIMNSLHDTVCHSEMHRHILSMWSNVQDEYEEFIAASEAVDPPVKRVQRSTVNPVHDSVVNPVTNSSVVDILT